MGLQQREVVNAAHRIFLEEEVSNDQDWAKLGSELANFFAKKENGSLEAFKNS